MEGLELVRHRKSIRTFDGKPLSDNTITSILDYAENVTNPYQLPITWKMLSLRKDGLSAPVIAGTDCFLAGKMKKTQNAEQAFGYAMEDIVLHLESLGFGTTWIAGTMDRASFEKAMNLEENEVLPCVTPVGYPAAKMPLREILLRKGISADSRLPFGKLFFEGDFTTPLSTEKAGALAEALEMVRLAPSAVNRQPWRVVLIGKQVHFFMQKQKVMPQRREWDLSKIDLGIAMYHFAYGIRQAGLTASFHTEDPAIPLPDNTFYIASSHMS